MHIKRTLWVIFSLLSLVFVSSVLAGGGLVEWLEINGPTSKHGNIANPGEQMTVRARVNLSNEDPYDSTIRWCKKCPIKIKLEDPQSDDIINQSSDVTDDNGEVYAKIISKQSAMRNVYTEVILPDGTSYTGSKAVLNFTGRILYWTPEGYKTPAEYEAMPKVHVDPPKIEITDSSKFTYKNAQRIVTLKVSGPKDTFLDIWTKPDGGEYFDNSSGARTDSGIAWVYVDPQKNHTIKAKACNQAACSDFSSEVYLSIGALATNPQPTSAPAIVASPTSKPAIVQAPQVIVTELKTSSETAQLQQKVEDLEKKLEESKKRQSALEQKFNELLSWVRSILPFFK